MQKEELLASIKRSRVLKKLPFLFDLLPDIMKPAIIFTPSSIDPALLKKGESRFGGVPDVPPNFIWPHVNQHPLLFIAQINLFDIAKIEPDTPLPKSGWLYFFGNQEAWNENSPKDLELKEVVKVVYIDAPMESLERLITASTPSFFRLDFHRIYTFPTDSREHPALDEAFKKEEQIYVAKEYQAYQKAYDKQLALYEKLIKEENIIPLTVSQWNALTSAERIRHREIESLRPQPMRGQPIYEGESIYFEFILNLEDKQLKHYKIEDSFRFLGYPSNVQGHYREHRESLLRLNVSEKKVPFPKEWAWWEELSFFIPTHDLENACFENVEGEIECS